MTLLGMARAPPHIEALAPFLASNNTVKNPPSQWLGQGMIRLFPHYLACHAICCHTSVTLYVASNMQYVLQLYSAI